MSAPKVSIGLPVYNGGVYLRTALDSILGQDFADFELIISDNASTDDTASICHAYAARDPRVRYARNPVNIGAGPNHVRVFEMARGELFKWAAHDDVHLPGFLRRCVHVLGQTPPSVVLVAPQTELIDDNGLKITTESWDVEHLDTRHPRPHQRVAAVLRRIAWATAQFGLFRTEPLRRTRLINPFCGSDHVLLFEIAILGEIWEIPEVLFQRRFHPGVSTRVNRTEVEFRQWFDPTLKPRRLFPGLQIDLEPRWRLAWECLRSIRRFGLSPREQLLCGAAALSILSVRESRRLAHEYSGRVRHRLGRLLGHLPPPPSLNAPHGPRVEHDP